MGISELVLALLFHVRTTIDVGLVTIIDTVDHGRSCTAIADHFDPWRANPLWAHEVSARPELIRTCTNERWSAALVYCLLDANSPLELDPCVNVAAREPHARKS